MSSRFLLLSALLALPIFPQQDMGVITGLVTDATGAAVPAVRVTVTNVETNETRVGETGATGAYTIGPLRVGTYDVTVEKSGFKREIWNAIPLNAQDRVRADFRLELGQVSESISVTAEAPALQSEQSSLSQVVEQKQVRDLPLNGRNLTRVSKVVVGRPFEKFELAYEHGLTAKRSPGPTLVPTPHRQNMREAL